MLIYLQMIETAEDQSKFEHIYKEYRKLMFRVALKYLKHEQDVEDAVHHAFVKIAENIKDVEPVSPKTRQYVVTIVENRAMDVLRMHSKHPILPFASAFAAHSQCAGCLLLPLKLIPSGKNASFGVWHLPQYFSPSAGLM